MNQTAKDIAKTLTGLAAYGAQPYAIWQDFIEISHQTMLDTPRHMQSIALSGKPADETKETLELWERVKARYTNPKPVFEGFCDAYTKIIEHARSDFEDILGPLHMELGGNPVAGQFFTPWHLCLMMAKMTIGDPKNTLDGKTTKNPLTICDHAVGSGSMLLAAASCFPSEALHGGLVAFYGQDIDNTCVLMSRLNLGIRGLLGHIRRGNSLTDE